MITYDKIQKALSDVRAAQAGPGRLACQDCGGTGHKPYTNDWGKGCFHSCYNCRGTGRVDTCPCCGRVGCVAVPSAVADVLICRICAATERMSPRPVMIEGWHFALALTEAPRRDFRPSECEGGGCGA